MRKTFFFFIGCIFLLMLSGCTPSKPQPAEFWGSFTNAPQVSWDGLYRAEHSAVKPDDSPVSMIEVRVYDNKTNELLDRFLPARAMDFWGICWEEGTHRIWTQSADVGTFCYELQDGRWQRNEAAQKPDSIVTKWEAE